jgi:hypothetical protein
LLNMLGCLEEEKRRQWRQYVPAVVHAYNCTRQTSTGFAPYELMFGPTPKLPVDVQFGLVTSEDRQSHTEWAQQLQESMEVAWRAATDEQERASKAQEKDYNRKVRGGLIELGDRVLVKNVGFQGPHKLVARWEAQPYQVVGKPQADSPVYVVQPIAGGRKRTLHRNMLLPLQGAEADTCPPVPATRPPARVKPVEEEEDSQSSDGDWEVTEWFQADAHAETEMVPEPVVPQQVPALVPRQDDQVPPRRSTRARKPPDRLCVGCRTALALC